MAFVANVLQSHQEIQLKQTSKVYVKVLGQEHMTVIRNRQHRVLSDAKVINHGIYQKSLPEIFKENYIISIPDGFDSESPLTKNCFEKRCLVLSIILGSYIELGKNLKWPNYKTKGELLWGMNSTVEKVRVKACEALLKEFEIIASKYPILTKDSSQTLEIACPILQEHFKVNVLIHQAIPKDVIVYKSPKIYDPTRPRVDLIQERDENVAHIGVISFKRYPYFDAKGLMCVICMSNKTGKSNRHRCEKIPFPSCTFCHRVISRNALLYKSSRELYCRGRYDNNPVKCSKCGITCHNRKTHFSITV